MFQRAVVVVSLILIASNGFAQNIRSQLDIAIQQLIKDAQFNHASIGLYVTDSKNGSVVFDKNSQLGLSPASCQKLVTSVSAFELLGREYRYKTLLSVKSAPGGFNNKTGEYRGIISVLGNGDPTLGSWRYANTGESTVIEKWLQALKKMGIKKIAGLLLFEDVNKFGEMSMLPDGYVWQDIGNYYGANTWLINWRENQYDIKFRSGTVNSASEIKSVNPTIPNLYFINKVSIGKPGSGDNAYIYCAPYSDTAYIMGTIPANKEDFSIAGAMPHPAVCLGTAFKTALKKNGIHVDSFILVTRGDWNGDDETNYPVLTGETIHYSPPLDSINYWFLKKSVNLYGEALLKSIGMLKDKKFESKNGIDAIKDFWNGQGIKKAALNIIDGSGLSPANRVTPHALVTVLQYAKKQPWFSSFYNALPEINGIKMKDGYIGGVRSYTGYVKGRTGVEYTFSFIVNNFDGDAGTARAKMWKVLDLLK